MKTRLSAKYFRTAAAILFLAAGICQAAQAEDTIYDVINREDTKAFSDMVMLGYDIDEQDIDGYTPLMIAAAAGTTCFVGYLIDYGAIGDIRYYQGVTAMHRAALGGYTDVFSALSDAGGNVNLPDLDGMTPLMIAAKNGHRFTVELLVRRGADVNFRNVKGETALDIANKYRYKEIARFLQNEGGRSKSPDSGKEASDGGNQGLGLDIDDWNDTEFDWGL